MTTTISGDTGVSQVQAGSIQPDDLVQKLTLGTAQNTTSGTSIDFTSIPSWVNRITLMLSGVSTNGTSFVQVQLGSTTIKTSGYLSSTSNIASASLSTTGASTGFVVCNAVAAATLLYGTCVLTHMGGGTWTCSSTLATGVTNVYIGAGAVSSVGVLDRFRLTTVNGTDVFDAGSVNILYEG